MNLSYISQQIIIAKYQFYIKGDIGSAFKLLESAKNQMKDYHLPNLEEQIQQEIQVLEGEITKWDSIDISVKERIDQSKFQKYINNA
ncbi:MAG: hypothetical protein ACXAD7_12915 [Candidatus Kariarchaeaceae archaeon]